MEVKTQIFAVPTSAGDVDHNISGWSETPKAAIIQLIGTDGTDSYDDHAVLSIGFTDGTTDLVCGIMCVNGYTTSETGRKPSSTELAVKAASGSNNISGTFSQWNTGGIEISWAGSDLSGDNLQVLITFFAGTDVSAKTLIASPGDHVTTVGFTSKLIFTTTSALSTTGRSTRGYLSHGICSNGTNGLTQQQVTFLNEDGVGTTELSSTVDTNSIAMQSYPTSWESAISSIDSSGFNLSASNADNIYFLCLTFDEDVDSGWGDIPTSGDVAVTAPGFTPQFVGLLSSNNDDEDSWNTGRDPNGIWIGAYDGTREHCVSVTGEEAVTTSNETSVHSSEIIHFEDPDQSVVFESSAIALDSSGFDITMSTNPSTYAVPFIWWAVEEESAGASPITGSISTSSTVSGDITGRARISGGSGLGADLKDAEEINDDANWTAYGTAVITQNGSWVNIVSGTLPSGGYIPLTDAVCLTADLTVGQKYSIRGIIDSVDAAGNVRFNDSGGDIDTVAFSSGVITQFALTGIYTGSSPIINFENLSSGEELNIYIYLASPVVGSTSSGDLIEKQNDLISGTITTASTVTGDIIGHSELSSTITTSSTVSGALTATVEISGSISTASTTTGDVKGNSELSGTINGSSTIQGAVIYPDIITQNGSWVNIIRGTKSTSARVYLDTDVLTGSLGDDDKYQVRAVAWSESGTVSVALYNDAGLEDSEEITALDTEQFSLTGFKTSSGDMYVSFTGFTEGEEINIYIYSVSQVLGTTVVGDIVSATPPHDYITGTITTSSTVTGAILGNTELSGTVSTSSTVSGAIVSFQEISGTISTSSSTSANIIGTTELSGSITTSSTVSGDLIEQNRHMTGTISTFSTVTGNLLLGSISGSITTSSTVSGAIIKYSSISGAITTSSTVSADVVGRAPLTASVSTSSTVSGDLVIGAQKGWITASVTTSSTVSGDLVIGAQKDWITGSVSTNSTVSGDLVLAAQKGWITATVTTSSTVQADLSRRYITLAGSISTSSTVTGSIIRHTSIEGTIITGSTVTGKLISEGSLSITIITASQVSGFVKAHNRRTVSISTFSTVSGDLVIGAQKGWMTATVTTSTTVQADLSRRYITLSGTIPTSTTVSGGIVPTTALRGTIITSSTVTGDIRGEYKLGGTITTSSTVSGFIKAYFRATASVSTSSTVSGDLVIGAQKGWISGAIASGATVSADLTIGARRRWITGSIATFSTLAADLIVGRTVKHVSGTISTSTTISAGISYKVHVSGSVSTISAVSGSLKGVGPLEGTIATASTVAGVVKGKTQMAVSLATSSTLSAVIRGTARISGSVVTGSTPAGHLVGRYELSVAMLTYSQITADVKAWGVLGGVVLGYSEIDGEIREKGVPRDWWDIVVPSDLLSGIVVAESMFEARTGVEEHKLIFPETDDGYWVYENNFGIPVVEDQYTGMPEEVNELLIVED